MKENRLPDYIPPPPPPPPKKSGLTTYYKHSLMTPIPVGQPPGQTFIYKTVYSKLSGEDFVKKSLNIFSVTGANGKTIPTIWQLYNTVEVSEDEYNTHT